MSEKKALIEAALFMSPDPVSLSTLEKITGITSKRELESILEELKKEYEVDTKGIELAITPEGYHFKVKEKFINSVSSLTPHADLSGGVLRTLGLIALRQPIAQSQIIKIQGNKAYGYIEKLEKKGLISSEKASRTKVLRTTHEFERYFGKSLKDIQENLRAVFESEAGKQPGTQGDNREIKAEDFTGENPEDKAV